MGNAIKKISYKEAAEFLSNNNQECPASLIQYGVFNGNRLKDIICFGQPTKNKHFQWEIIANTIEDNNLIKITWQSFIGENKVRSCVSYLDGIDYSSLGFNKVDDYYSYFPFGVLYRVDDIDDGCFYIGETTNEIEWDNGYIGSGGIWSRHHQAHPEHNYVRTIIKDNFLTPELLYKAEEKEIRKYSSCVDEENDIWKISDPNCKNYKTTGQHCGYNGYEACPECGGIHSHKKGCSRDNSSGMCPYCGTPAGGMHTKECPNFKPVICPECGGRSHMHKKGCSKYKAKEPCPECGSVGVSHRKHCSKYKKPKGCPECGVISGHLKTCSKYKMKSICPECGGKGGKHKSICSKSKKCPECGSVASHHLKTCSKYVPKISKAVCSECGGKAGHHYVSCSKFKTKINKCPECGNKNGHHKTTCSHYKDPGECPECGYSLQSHRHAVTCSHYKPPKICQECGLKNGHHKKTCSQHKPKTNK